MARNTWQKKIKCFLIFFLNVCDECTSIENINIYSSTNCSLLEFSFLFTAFHSNSQLGFKSCTIRDIYYSNLFDRQILIAFRNVLCRFFLLFSLYLCLFLDLQLPHAFQCKWGSEFINRNSYSFILFQRFYFLILFSLMGNTNHHVFLTTASTIIVVRLNWIIFCSPSSFSYFTKILQKKFFSIS